MMAFTLSVALFSVFSIQTLVGQNAVKSIGKKKSEIKVITIVLNLISLINVTKINNLLMRHKQCSSASVICEVRWMVVERRRSGSVLETMQLFYGSNLAGVVLQAN